jgi:hypothetical protein
LSGGLHPVYPRAMINIRDLSIRCGQCMNFMTLASYAPREGWNAYTYECESGTCDAAATRTVVEVPVALDEFAQRGCPTER